MKLEELMDSLAIGLPMAIIGPFLNSIAIAFSTIGEPIRSILIILAVVSILAAFSYIMLKWIPAPRRIRKKINIKKAAYLAMAGTVLIFVLSPLYLMLIQPFPAQPPLECSTGPCGGVAPVFNTFLITIIGIIIIILATVYFAISRSK